MKWIVVVFLSIISLLLWGIGPAVGVLFLGLIGVIIVSDR